MIYFLYLHWYVKLYNVVRHDWQSLQAVDILNLAHLSVLNSVAHKHFLAWKAFFLEGKEKGMNGFSSISSQILQHTDR